MPRSEAESKPSSTQLRRERASVVANVAADVARLASKQKKLATASFEACQKLLDELLHLETFAKSFSTLTEEFLNNRDKLERETGAVFENLSLREKELKAAISKYSKNLESCFGQEAYRTCRGLPLDKGLLERAIGEHLFREGQFDIAESFAKVSGQKFEDAIRFPFKEMYSILNSIREGELEPAIHWAQRNYVNIHSGIAERDTQLDTPASSSSQSKSHPASPANELRKEATASSFIADQIQELEFKLHRLQVITLLQDRRLSEALSYARQHLSRFQRSQSKEIQQLMACFAFASRISQSPYASLFTSALCDDVMHTFRRCFWMLLNLSDESPLYSVIACGTIALPHLIRANRLLAARESWSERDELPVEVDLGRKYKYHSVFVCPVSREQSTENNPPYLLPCGHVLCKETVSRLPRGNARFKCPYCPSEQQVAACRQIHF
jgi:hypothetical protein